MKLKSDTTYWLQIDGGSEPYPPLGRDLACEVAIIGGGITGALVAFHLAEAGIGSVIVDRREVCQGSTSASTGLLQYEIDTSLVELTHHIGVPRAFRAYSLCEQALRKFPLLVEKLGDSCGLMKKQSLYLASRAEHAKELVQEHAARQACDLDVQYLSAAQLREQFSIERPAALLSPLALQVDPYRLARQLIQRAAAMGVEVYSHTHVVQYDVEAGRVALRTEGGNTIRARHVVFATGYETPEFVHVDVQLKSTFAMVSEPLPLEEQVVDKCLIWEAARPYLYVRTTADHRVMVGGEDVPVTDATIRDAMIPGRMKILSAKFGALFPKLRIKPEVGWAGMFAETSDGLPFIGSNARFPLGYFALGYGGNGILFSLIAAELIRDALLKRANPDAEIFRFDR